MRHQHRRSAEPLTRVKPLKTKGAIMKHVIAKGEDEKRDYYLHATKGYRARKS